MIPQLRVCPFTAKPSCLAVFTSWSAKSYTRTPGCGSTTFHLALFSTTASVVWSRAMPEKKSKSPGGRAANFRESSAKPNGKRCRTCVIATSVPGGAETRSVAAAQLHGAGTGRRDHGALAVGQQRQIGRTPERQRGELGRAGNGARRDEAAGGFRFGPRFRAAALAESPRGAIRSSSTRSPAGDVRVLRRRAAGANAGDARGLLTSGRGTASGETRVRHRPAVAARRLACVAAVGQAGRPPVGVGEPGTAQPACQPGLRGGREACMTGRFAREPGRRRSGRRRQQEDESDGDRPGAHPTPTVVGVPAVDQWRSGGSLVPRIEVSRMRGGQAAPEAARDCASWQELGSPRRAGRRTRCWIC